MSTETDKPILNALRSDGQKSSIEIVPWWLMRQAGRYLPEYRDLRAQAGGFLDLVYNPDFATEVTLQPIRRYGMSAAILFSDILVVPHALGQEVRFEAGEGPKLAAIKDRSGVSALSFSEFEKTLKPIYQTVNKVRTDLKAENFDQTALIGFCGAPWTVACYMVEGGGSKDFMNVKAFAYGDTEGFQQLIDLLIEASVEYLCAQVAYGAEVLQIFDSWSGVLDESGFQRWVIQPTAKIIEGVKGQYPNIPIIGFPRGAGLLSLNYALNGGIDGIGLDPSIPTRWAAEALQPHVLVQGNLDPARLLAGGDELLMAVEKIRHDLSGGRFIFNLGHGVHKETDPARIDELKTYLY